MPSSFIEELHAVSIVRDEKHAICRERKTERSRELAGCSAALAQMQRRSVGRNHTQAVPTVV